MFLLAKRWHFICIFTMIIIIIDVKAKLCQAEDVYYIRSKFVMCDMHDAVEGTTTALRLLKEHFININNEKPIKDVCVTFHLQ